MIWMFWSFGKSLNVIKATSLPHYGITVCILNHTSVDIPTQYFADFHLEC